MIVIYFYSKHFDLPLEIKTKRATSMNSRASSWETKDYFNKCNFNKCNKCKTLKV